jgi:tRNA-intron endonuclease
MNEGRIRGFKTYLNKEEAEELILKDYGEEKRKYLVLKPLETLYLMFIDKIKVKKGKKYLDLNHLINFYSKINPSIFSLFLIYRDLKSRGYIVKPGYGERIDFLVYERGEYPEKPAKLRVIGVDEGNPISILKLIDILKFSTMSKKELKIAVIERRGDVVYYTLKEFYRKERKKQDNSYKEIKNVC